MRSTIIVKVDSPTQVDLVEKHSNRARESVLNRDDVNVYLSMV